MYEALTGKIAFEAPNVAQILMKIINQSPTPVSQMNPGLPPRLDDVIEKGIRKDKLKRYSDASSMAKDFCEAYGLEGDVERWAAASVADIAQALETAQPPAAKAFGVMSELPPAMTGGGGPSMRVHAAGGAGGMSASMPSDEFPAKNSMTTVIGVAVGALVLIVVLAALRSRSAELVRRIRTLLQAESRCAREPVGRESWRSRPQPWHYPRRVPWRELPRVRCA